MGHSRLTGWRLRVLALSVVLSMAGYVALSLWGGHDEVVAGIRAVGVSGILGALAFAGWGAEALALWWLLGLVGIEVDLLHATFIFALAMLAGALSLIPGGLASSGAVMTGPPVLAGGTPGDAMAGTLVLRLCTLWFAVLPDLAALLTFSRGESA
jgi:uncharacterized membrane protein YbhN (UPF0104 family)